MGAPNDKFYVTLRRNLSWNTSFATRAHGTTQRFGPTLLFANYPSSLFFILQITPMGLFDPAERSPAFIMPC
jgi:hypothetical protein